MSEPSVAFHGGNGEGPPGKEVPRNPVPGLVGRGLVASWLVGRRSKSESDRRRNRWDGMHAPIRTHQFLLRHFYLQSKGPGEGLCGFCQTQTLCLIFYGLYPSGQVRVVESSVYKLVGRSKVENAFKVQIQCCQSHVPTSLLWQTGTQLIFISQISMHLLSFLSILGTGQHNRTK
jgi:hypothetical protein